jgi:tRNA dimethylallyltransferase
MKHKPKVLAVVGPTASGKTTLAVVLAHEFDGEVISADSRQVYRGLDIGTGKATEVEKQGVPHHLIDCADLKDIYTGEQFFRDASRLIQNISSAGKVPVIAGGTFFYIDLLRGKMQAAPVAPDVAFRETLENYTNEELLDLLRSKDERRANTVDPNNRRRLVRALEIIETLGKVPEQTAVESEYDWLLIGIDIEKETLRAKFSDRLSEWLDRGLLEEVARIKAEVSHERFLELGFEYTLTADYIEKKITKEEFFEQFVQKNWQYAKRQLTWLKRDQTIQWFSPDQDDKVVECVSNFLRS